MSELLRLDGLTVTARDTGERLVDRVSLSLPKGGSLVLIGQSGSGKTMLCRCVMDLLNSRTLTASGQVLFEGQDLMTLPSKQRRQLYGKRIALIPQNPMTAFDPSQKMGTQLRETLRVHKKVSRQEADDRIRDALRAAGLTDGDKVMHSYPFMLSGGMLQRCAIAMAVLLHTDLVLADEPTTALDAEHRIAITQLLAALRTHGTAVLLVTHDFVSAQAFGGPAAVMKDGRITERGTVDQLFTHPGDDYTRQLLEAALI